MHFRRRHFRSYRLPRSTAWFSSVAVLGGDLAAVIQFGDRASAQAGVLRARRSDRGSITGVAQPSNILSEF